MNIGSAGAALGMCMGLAEAALGPNTISLRCRSPCVAPVLTLCGLTIGYNWYTFRSRYYLVVI